MTAVLMLVFVVAIIGMMGLGAMVGQLTAGIYASMVAAFWIAVETNDALIIGVAILTLLTCAVYLSAPFVKTMVGEADV